MTIIVLSVALACTFIVLVLRELTHQREHAHCIALIVRLIQDIGLSTGRDKRYVYCHLPNPQGSVQLRWRRPRSPAYSFFLRDYPGSWDGHSAAERRDRMARYFGRSEA